MTFVSNYIRHFHKPELARKTRVLIHSITRRRHQRQRIRLTNLACKVEGQGRRRHRSRQRRLAGAHIDGAAATHRAATHRAGQVQHTHGVKRMKEAEREVRVDVVSLLQQTEAWRSYGEIQTERNDFIPQFITESRESVLVT